MMTPTTTTDTDTVTLSIDGEKYTIPANAKRKEVLAFVEHVRAAAAKQKSANRAARAALTKDPKWRKQPLSISKALTQTAEPPTTQPSAETSDT
jgi:hypothetical protein